MAEEILALLSAENGVEHEWSFSNAQCRGLPRNCF